MTESAGTNSIEKAAGILRQLSEYVRQLAASERDPDVDVATLSEACGERLEELKKVLPAAMATERTEGPHAENRALTMKVREIREQLGFCCQALERGRDKTRKELENITASRKAIRAYSG